MTACRPGEGEGCERELEKALGELKRAGATAYILDIRDNPGGLLDQAFAVSNLFLKKGQLVVYTRGRTRRDESNYITEEESPWSERPARGADLASQRERERDRGGGAAGPRPRAHRRRDHVRQGARADDHAAAQRARLRARPHHGALLHAVGPLDPARLRLDRPRGVLRAPRPQALRPGQQRDEADGLRAQGLRRRRDHARTTASSRRRRRSSSRTSSRGRPSPTSRAATRPRTGQGQAAIAGTGTRSQAASTKVKPIRRDFRVDDAVLREFRAYVESRKLRSTDEDFTRQPRRDRAGGSRSRC